MKYQYKGDTTYRNLEIGQTVIFVYSNAELTKKGKPLFRKRNNVICIRTINSKFDKYRYLIYNKCK